MTTATVSVAAAMTRAAPSVGTRAAVPGNGVAESKVTAAQAIMARPSQPRTARTAGCRSRQPRWTASASSDPRPSSQTRVCVTK